MYGLFEYNYDYDELERLVRVSDNKKDLLNHYYDNDGYIGILAEDGVEHEVLSKIETDHYMIKEVKVI